MQDNLENFQNEEKQMTALRKYKVGASSTCMQWNNIDWAKAQEQVRKLQMRIAKATREGKHNRAKALQWVLTHSFHAKALAVKRITENTGGKTAGVDNIVWRTSKQKVQAIKSMQRRGYQPQSLRRIYIPKKNGRLRPLSIPTMKDRAMQALYLLALEPIAETQADKSSYGFRPKRSTADAIGHCFYALARSYAPQWILEGDIKACFDCIDHRWLIIHASIDKTILQKWLAAGYQEKGKFYRTEAGVPQGGIISPVLANIALDGLEQTVKSLSNKSNKVHVVRYADDFIVTGNSQEFLEQKIKPAIKQFLAERGLELSTEKTKVTSIQDGFDFLGFNVRKYKGKLLIKPAKSTVKAFLEEIQ